MSRGILVAGDFIADHHIYEGRRHHFAESAEAGVRIRRQLGGAALVADILRELLNDGFDVVLPPDQDSVDAPRTAYAFWRPFPPKDPPERQFWRVAEAMGFGTADPAARPKSKRRKATSNSMPSVVVLSEGGMGFRDSPDDWPKEMASAKWIVLKGAAPLGTGPLWAHLAARHRDRLVVIVSAQELRTMPARLSKGLSWEETLGNLLIELNPKGVLGSLTRCRHLIVSFGAEGAIWIDFGAAKGIQKTTRVHFVHDAPAIEGERGVAVAGKVFGLQSCLAAAVAWQLTKDAPDLPAALESGLSGMRDLIEKGHGRVTDDDGARGFPAARLAQAIENPAWVYSRAVFDAGVTASGRAWTLLGESLRKHGPAYDLARVVLLRGPIALASLPHLRIGQLVTAERQEIESLRTLVQVVRRYQDHDKGKKPLSLGVFGPPGAGKSFAVRELAGQVIRDAGWLEFNLSQFSDPDDLIGAFHQIRDQVLQGKLPVAFFDEFDARNYQWLAPLLAPMQDGKFQDGQITHTLGKCVFVFAGGTSWTFDTFGPPPPVPGKPDESPEWRHFRLTKGPDFKSRIDGYLNVVGPNQRVIPVDGRPRKGQRVTWVGGHPMVADPEDACFPIRRALMIRTELKRGENDKLDLDEGVVNALLKVDAYTHGARSLGKILQPFAAAGRGPLGRSLLLPAPQLAMHVNAKAFLQLCGTPPPPNDPSVRLTRSQIELIAPAIHETWRELGRKGGWLEPEDDVAFADLSDFKRDSSRAAAERMLDHLHVVGLDVEPGLGSQAQEQRVRDQLEYVLETLAEAEHNGWMDWHLARGWRWAAKRDDDKQRHPCLKPYLQLPKAEVEKDRDAIRHYPDFARKARMKIVELERGDEVRGSG